MTEKLYIIGNGFDLHHGLKTSYYHFANYLKSKDSELYSILESYISYPNSDKDLWSRFEENLSNLDTDEILSEHSDTLLNYTSDDFRDGDRYIFPDTMDNYYQKLTDGLFEIFQNFIQDVEFPSIASELKLEIDANFLTFNYTNTLEQLYNVDKKTFYISITLPFTAQSILF